MAPPFDAYIGLVRDCSICAKHLGEGSLGGTRVWEDDLVVVYHAPPGFLGHLFVESKRHAPYVDDLTDDEASCVGRAVARAARALRAETGAEFMIAAVIGMGVAHFHEHVVARHPGTPADVKWHQSDEWADAPHIDGADLDAFCARLRAHFG